MKSNQKKVLIVVGTRPNFIKVTQFKKLAQLHETLDLRIVHTGQHYDNRMADIFFSQFELVPDFFLNISAGGPNRQIAQIMTELENVINDKFKPDLLIAVGDVNSTLAAALTANKLGIRLAHLESGLRSNDRTMPEEINRIITDELSDIFFVTEESGADNLKIAGVEDDRIVFVGNTMIDTMVAFSSQIENAGILNELNVQANRYVLMTIHRPATVDSKEGLLKLIDLLKELSSKYEIIFPIHPRTTANIKKFGLETEMDLIKNLQLTEPLDYFSFQKLIKHSRFIVTDSGGIQEECTFLGVPCLTLRPNTERPVTCTIGTNTLLPFESDIIRKHIALIERGEYKKGKIPKFWDGKSTERILQYLLNN